MLTPTPSTQSCFLIMMQPPLVMLDIVETIADFAPGAAVIQVGTPQETTEALQKVKFISTAILRMSPTSATAKVLAKAIRDLGGQVVFYGDAAEDVGPGKWTILKSPFTTSSLMAILRSRRQAGLAVAV